MNGSLLMLEGDLRPLVLRSSSRGSVVVALYVEVEIIFEVSL
jgi:hypothetical protein